MGETLETAEQRERAASEALYEQEDFLRRMDYLSDEELTQQLVTTLRKEKEVVDGWIDSGDCFLLASSGKVHLPDCTSMRQFVDRDAAWAPYLRDLERVRDWHGSDNAPAMPRMLTRTQVEGLRAYKTCPLCAPTLDHTDKRHGIRGWTTLKAASLKTQHFGKEFSLADGTSIGELTRISKVETAAGVKFQAEFSGRDVPVSDPSTILMYTTSRVEQEADSRPD